LLILKLGKLEDKIQQLNLPEYYSIT